MSDLRRACVLGWLCLTAPLAVLAPRAAAAQDSFVRISDPVTGEHRLSVLGMGLGRPYVAMTLDLACPSAESWQVAVRGGPVAEGAPVVLGLADILGRRRDVRVADAEMTAPDQVRLVVDRASFDGALAAIRGARADAPGSEMVLILGADLGLAVELDALVEEMGRLAAACAPGPAPARQARYAR